MAEQYPRSDQPVAGDGSSDEQSPDGQSSDGQGPDVPLRGARALLGEKFSFVEAVGGVRGLVESVLPGTVFVVVYVATSQLVPTLVASLAVAVVAVLVRLVQRTPWTQAFSGLLGVGIGVLWAWSSGRAEDYFAWGLWVNAAWFVGALASIPAGWPAVGVVVSLLRGEPMTWRTRWRTDAGLAQLRRRYVWATWLFVALFGLRLAVQVPLYFQGEDSVGWLGTAKLVMGVPLFAVALWLTWLLVRRPGAAAEPADRPATPPR